MLSQTDKIFGSILIAFLIYITIEGQLPAYLNLFVGGSATAGNGTTSTSSSSNPLSGLSSAISSITNIASSVGAFFGF